MTLQEALALGDTPVPVVKVHPTVVFSILNSFVRREKRDFRVIGTLLGVVKDGQIEVKIEFLSILWNFSQIKFGNLAKHLRILKFKRFNGLFVHAVGI